MSRDYAVTASADATGPFREEWLTGTTSAGTSFALDTAISGPTLTLNVFHGDRVVRESMDLQPMLTAWAKDLTKEMKRNARDLDD